MKKKWMIAGLASAVLASGSAGAVAGANLQQIKAYLHYGLKVEVNGDVYTLKDGNGKTLTPITYGGLTYLPTRALADALDVPITYDAANQKVKIGTSASSAGTSSGTASGTKERPQYLPLDFPIPYDAIITVSTDSILGGVRQSKLVYYTKESLDTMGTVYKEYVRIKGLGEGTQSVTSAQVSISGRLGSVSPITIKGAVSKTKAGYNEFSISWSES